MPAMPRTRTLCTLRHHYPSARLPRGRCAPGAVSRTGSPPRTFCRPGDPFAKTQSKDYRVTNTNEQERTERGGGFGIFTTGVGTYAGDSMKRAAVTCGPAALGGTSTGAHQDAQTRSHITPMPAQCQRASTTGPEGSTPPAPRQQSGVANAYPSDGLCAVLRHRKKWRRHYLSFIAKKHGVPSGVFQSIPSIHPLLVILVKGMNGLLATSLTVNFAFAAGGPS